MNGTDLENSISDLLVSDLYESDGFVSSDQELSSSGSSEESGEYESNPSSSYNDYTVILTGIESGLYDLNSQASSATVELAMINNRLNRIEESTNTVVSLLIVFTIFAVIKICFAIFNKILGLGQA